ncbi:hypothetical protein [Acinetobacter baumannii]|uniref:hypothetical protein n=1 Tax=Acinetobacter baumannii TaxID=470 RepID=UPI000A74110F|nr:hypothetical protein [Acinetobacter baumannii]
MEEFEQWYLDTYYKPYGFVPPANLFERYEDTYIRENVYQHNLVWQHQQAKVEKLQKRVDAALAVLTEYYTGSYDESPDLVVDIEQALKGEDSE